MLAAVVVLVAVAAMVAVVPRGTTAISDSDALETFRARDAPRSAPVPVGPGPDEMTPPPGVYSYAASGEEVVQLGPLPAQTRILPDRITAIARGAVTRHGTAGCVEWTLNLFSEHVETTRYCRGEDAMVLDEHTKAQRVGALSPTATMVCDPGLVPISPGTSAKLRCELTLSGGPASIDADLTGPVRATAREAIVVDGVAIEVTPVAFDLEVGGDLSGSWTERTWWTDDMVPVRIERSLDLEGLASFSERSELALLSIEPVT